MRRMDTGLVLCIVLAGLFMTWSGLTAPGMWWTDESRHSMHGAFFVDFLKDLPWRTPYDYVQRYFAQYPALAFNWYLPLFPMGMGLVMSVAGVSEFSAHATVIGVWPVSYTHLDVYKRQEAWHLDTLAGPARTRARRWRYRKQAPGCGR